MSCRGYTQVPITLHPIAKPEPYVDEEGFTDLACRNEIDLGGFGEDQPRPGPCRCNLFVVQGNEDGRFRLVCSRCGHVVTVQTIPGASP